MKINNNISAKLSLYKLNKANDKYGSSLEKLSSGKKLVRSSDDPSAYSTARKIRDQIKGLRMAKRNALDAVSLMNTAEGALEEVHSMLQKMKELSMKATNETMVKIDKMNVQNEFNELAKEISRISSASEFNKKPLLDGSFENVFHIGANKGESIYCKIEKIDAEKLLLQGSNSAKIEVSGAAADNGTGTLANTADTYEVVSKSDYTGATINFANSITNEAATNYILTDTNGDAVATSSNGLVYSEIIAAPAVNADTITFVNSVVDGEVMLSGSVGVGEAKGKSDITGHLLGKGEYEISTDNIPAGFNVGLKDTDGKIIALGATDLIGTAAANASLVTEWVDVKDTSISMLSQNAETNMSGKILVEDEGIDITAYENAEKAVSAVDNAIAIVSSQRSRLGAYQTRLENSVKTLEQGELTFTEVVSKIEDLDMAEEMVELTKQQILVQAGTAMLSQANARPESLLRILN